MQSTIVAGAMRWGSWGARFSRHQYQQMIETCLQAGISWFDHADIYGHHSTEAEFGEALAEMSGVRDRIHLITKAGIVMADAAHNPHGIKHYKYSPAYLLAQLNTSLQQLRTDQVDLWLLHRPSPLMNVEQAAQVLQQALDQGKTKAVGVSNFNLQEVEAIKACLPISHHQFECSLSHTKPLTDGLFHQSHRLQIMPQIWSPLGGGPDALVAQHPSLKPVLQQMNERLGYSHADALLAFVCSIPYDKQIVAGSSQPQRLVRMKQVADAGPLPPELWFALYEAVRGHEVA